MLQDLNRQVVKSEKAVFSIPHLKFEQPASKGGKKTYNCDVIYQNQTLSLK